MKLFWFLNSIVSFFFSGSQVIFVVVSSVLLQNWTTNWAGNGGSKSLGTLQTGTREIRCYPRWLVSKFLQCYRREFFFLTFFPHPSFFLRFSLSYLLSDIEPWLQFPVHGRLREYKKAQPNYGDQSFFSSHFLESSTRLCTAIASTKRTLSWYSTAFPFIQLLLKLPSNL